MEYKQITLTEIYIPICFYFNTIRFFTCIICTNIYIPICFYFNARKRQGLTQEELFTFQYVSILIDIHVPANTVSLAFTFQYVSILITDEAFELIDDICIYIPICFYFNKLRPDDVIQTPAFTFQYVSILI